MALSLTIDEKHAAAIIEMMAELGTGDDVPDSGDSGTKGKSQATTRALMVNNGFGNATFQEKKDWSGSVIGAYPPSLGVNRPGKYTHRGVPPKDFKGSKGAVVYVGSNVQAGPINSAWILAWNVPGDGSPNQIYVETGPNTKYGKGNVDWDSIQNSLNNPKSESHYRDEDTGAEASAKINATGNSPAASAVFDISIT
ncbi:jasmonate-induced protein homolog [Beta vulgaris subsp. vulgaris]|uniref:jasmonate-induced protein homolog n=1 Tax=Beta vulgaris subsp. vulgaris TaxID=3555 RepID=UPI0020366EFA|nr:jasmonate-induced protein homolog [Beta vulgaris subsp. vulgaris]